MNNYILELADMPVNCTFKFNETAGYFGNWIKETNKETPGLSVSDLFWNNWTRQIDTMNARNEYSAFAMAASDLLLSNDRCLFHAAAVSFRGKAWLITAPSGVGKSTQVLTLQKLYPGKFGVISGDKPILQFNNNLFIVHPSPWNGKEGWHGAEKAQLAGIVCLQRGIENQIEKMTSNNSAARVFTGILQTGERESTIRKAAYFTEQLITNTPVWLLTNKGVPESTVMLYEMILEESENEV